MILLMKSGNKFTFSKIGNFTFNCLNFTFHNDLDSDRLRNMSYNILLLLLSDPSKI